MSKLDPSMKNLLLLSLVCSTMTLNAQEHFKVQAVPSEGGTVLSTVQETAVVEGGSVLEWRARPARGFTTDVLYTTYQGGMWGTESTLWYGDKARTEVDRDLDFGAVFIPKKHVNHLEITREVVYAQPGVKALAYDVYSPRGAKDLPAIVIIHGGGWSSNDQSIMRALAWELTQGGQFVVISVDYRWINTLDGDATPNEMHDLIGDVFGALAHIREHAKEYGADPNRLGITGDSAGGHLTACAAFLTPLLGNTSDGEPRSIVPTYLPQGYQAKDLQRDLEASIKAVAPSYAPIDARDFMMFLRDTSQAYLDFVSPNKHIPSASTRTVPHFMVRGTLDPLIPEAMVESYAADLRAQGHPVEVHHIEGATHAFFDWKPDATTRATFEQVGVPYAQLMKAFFLKYL